MAIWSKKRALCDNVDIIHTYTLARCTCRWTTLFTPDALAERLVTFLTIIFLNLNDDTKTKCIHPYMNLFYFWLLQRQWQTCVFLFNLAFLTCITFHTFSHIWIWTVGFWTPLASTYWTLSRLLTPVSRPPLRPLSWTLRHLIKISSSRPHWRRQRWGISHNHEVEMALHSSQIIDEFYCGAAGLAGWCFTEVTAVGTCSPSSHIYTLVNAFSHLWIKEFWI